MLSQPADERLSEEQDCTLAVDAGVSHDLVDNRLVLETLDVAVQPQIVYVEDTFVYELLQKLDRSVLA